MAKGLSETYKDKDDYGRLPGPGGALRQRASRRLHPLTTRLQGLRQRMRRHPIQAVFLILFTLLFVLWVAMRLTWIWLVNGDFFERFYWNYGVYLHPGMERIMPIGLWNPPYDPPRWVPEVYDAPWMGEWDVPALSPPVYKGSELVSPAIVKLHVFSTARESARQKRAFIRSVSPLYNIPPAYRHLIELKFILGHAVHQNGTANLEEEDKIEQEQETYGDLVRLQLKNGENLREGKILQWIHAVGAGLDSNREAWYVFKVDDDSVLHLPNFLDSLLRLDQRQAIYLGTSLNRWPSYHAHFTGMVTGFSLPLVKTLSAGIGNMTKEEIERAYDDDVLTGELMYDLPSGPWCRSEPGKTKSLAAYCDPRRPPPWGWRSNPPTHDPRTGLYRHDYGRHMGDNQVWFCKNDVAAHSYHFKKDENYLKYWEKNVRGAMWTPPKAFKQLADASSV